MEKLDTILDHVNDLLNDDNRKAFSAALDHVEKFTGTLADHRDDVGRLVTDADDAVKKFGALAGDLNALENKAAAITDADKLVEEPW